SARTASPRGRIPRPPCGGSPHRPRRGSASAMLRLPRFQLHAPATVRDAALLLQEHRAAEQDAAKTGTPGIAVMLVAGGTDLFPNMKRRQFTPTTLIALGKALPRTIHNGNGLSIGAGATLTSVALDARVIDGYRA